MHAAAAEAEAKVASLTAALSAAKDDMAALQETVKLQAAELARHQARNFFCNSFNLRIREKKIGCRVLERGLQSIYRVLPCKRQ